MFFNKDNDIYSASACFPVTSFLVLPNIYWQAILFQQHLSRLRQATVRKVDVYTIVSLVHLHLRQVFLKVAEYFVVFGYINQLLMISVHGLFKLKTKKNTFFKFQTLWKNK